MDKRRNVLQNDTEAKGQERYNKRRAAYQYGLKAETLSLLFLLIKGYRPLARRFKAAGGEVDIIAKRGKTIVFVEVKARLNLEAAMKAIDAHKQRRFSKAARAWLTRNSWAENFNFRADAIFIVRGSWPVHQKAAFCLDLH